MNFATEIYYHVMHRSNSKININVTLPKVNYAAKNPYIKLPPIINFIDSNRQVRYLLKQSKKAVIQNHKTREHK